MSHEDLNLKACPFDDNAPKIGEGIAGFQIQTLSDTLLNFVAYADRSPR